MLCMGQVRRYCSIETSLHVPEECNARPRTPSEAYPHWSRRARLETAAGAAVVVAQEVVGVAVVVVEKVVGSRVVVVVEEVRSTNARFSAEF